MRSRGSVECVRTSWNLFLEALTEDSGLTQPLFSWMVQVAVLTSFGAAPWVVKPIYGFLSDTVPIFGYKRRSYLILCGLCGTSHPPLKQPPKPRLQPL